ncbi:TIGR00288 family protein [Eubacterium oxidoreducens]|uniref:TIGR00288 family protein n=2 Tax=Eubacterium oxidoreducens TaxID=1732 RepID=A0A1G6AB97_EUBOX|nr:TIGR00288 family protein [Eubacterium oxidoreducens]
MEEKTIAILIDGDNISPQYAEYIKSEAQHLGRIKISRLYGSISSPTVKAWYRVMPEQGITPMLQISYANGKSIADQALTIDAMDILHSGDVDMICLVSSDSDFTKLVYRIKEDGITVIGMGEKKTSQSLVNACDEFRLLDLIYNNDLKSQNQNKQDNAQQSEKNETVEVAEDTPINVPKLEAVLKAIKGYLDNDWENLAGVGTYLSKRLPGFDSRIYGYRNISELIREHENLFDLKTELAEDKVHQVVYVKNKRKNNSNKKKKTTNS